MILGIDHGYYSIKTRNSSFLAGIAPLRQPQILHPPERAHVRRVFFCLRQWAAANPERQDRQRQLLSADAGGHCQRDRSPRRAAGVQCDNCGWAAADRPRTGKACLRKYLLRNADQPTEFGHEGKKYHITIEDVLLFPQGFTALMAQPDLLTDGPSMLRDISRWTVDPVRIDNDRPIIGTCHSLEFGMIRCIDEVRERVRQDTGLSLTDVQIEQVLAGRPYSLDETVRSPIREQGRLYTERLLSAVSEAGFDYHALPIVTMGGGTSVVSRHFRPSDGLCRTVVLPDDRVNAQGYERAVAALCADDAQG